jgi:tRNA G10  N-methylase Trm11
LKEFSVADVADLPAGTFDAIICDPPYGFNTEEDRVEIIEFAELLVSKIG